MEKRAITKIQTAVIIAIILVAGAAGAYLLTKPSVAKASFILDIFATGEHVPLYAAVAQGYFRSCGLDVTLVPSSGDIAAVQAVAAGKQDFGLTDLGALINQIVREHITGVRAVAVYAHSEPAGILYNKDHGIAKPKDLENKTVGLIESGAAHLLFPFFAKHVGLDVSKLHVVSMAAPIIQPSLLNGKVDAVIFFTRAAQDFSVKYPNFPLGVFAFKDYGINAYSESVITTTQMIERNPGEVSCILQGFGRGVQYAVQHPQDAVNDFVKSNPSSDSKIILAEWTNWMIPTIGREYANSPTPLGVFSFTDDGMAHAITVFSQAYEITAPSASAVYINQFIKSG